MDSSLMVGRGAERARLAEALARAQEGAGSFVLLAGEAGVGKTRLVQEVARSSGGPALTGRAAQGAVAPYGPITELLRAQLRHDPGAADAAGPLASHLAPVLPELGPATEEVDRAALVEALRRMLAAAAADGPRIVLLDDLHWSDDATLELVPDLAAVIADLPLLAVGAYRSDGLPRDHLVRRVRHELRRAGRLDELVLAPLEPEETAELVAAVMDEPPAPELVATIHDRTQGLPFFVEELARALEVTGDAAPLPDTIRDAVMVSTSDLSAEARAAADAAAVAGDRFSIDVVAKVAGAEELAELVGCGLVIEREDGTGSFRHALTREALYADIPWLQRRALHRRLAEELERAGAASGERAIQWLGAREEGRAREALLEAARESCAVYAYRDAARFAQQALELWPEGEEVDARLAALNLYARSAEYSGQLAEAARALREMCTIEASTGAGLPLAEAQRRLGGVHDLRGDRDAAATARRVAADTFAAKGHPAEAAVELLALANYGRASADYSAATELTQAALREAERAERVDLRARALGLDGVVREKGGDPEGLQTVREGLALALEHDLTSVAAELYQRLSLALYDSADYRRAREALDSALELCEAGDSGTEVACITCLVYVLRESGEWEEALSLSRELIESGTAVWVAEGLMGVILGYQGKFGSARRLLASAHAAATSVDHFNMSVDSASGLAWIAAAQRETEQAAEHYRWLIDRWERSEDHHYAVRGLRQGAAFLARQGDLRGAHACSEVLATIASDTGGREALAALAHSIGEAALAEGDAVTAAEQMAQAIEAHRTLDTPLERAEISLRAGVAAAAAGERELGLERLGDAYRLARKLGARPLAAEAADEVSALGESVERRLGRRANADEQGLTRRELEVMRHVAAGETNKEIAQELFLSPRTVDMHVRNILRKLDCPTRAAASTRANELGLLTG